MYNFYHTTPGKWLPPVSFMRLGFVDPLSYRNHIRLTKENLTRTQAAELVIHLEGKGFVISQAGYDLIIEGPA